MSWVAAENTAEIQHTQGNLLIYTMTEKYDIGSKRFEKKVGSQWTEILNKICEDQGKSRTELPWILIDYNVIM